MSAEFVRESLDRFEQAASSRGSRAMREANAGLSSRDIDAIERGAGVCLSADAREIWKWRNGGAEYPIFWGSGYRFPDLSTAIALGRQSLDVRNMGDIFAFPEAAWITLGGGSISVIVDLTDPLLESSPVYVNDPTADVHDYPIVSLADRIGWWTWAIENDVHRVNPSGQWVWNFENVPVGPERNLM